MSQNKATSQISFKNVATFAAKFVVLWIVGLILKKFFQTNDIYSNSLEFCRHILLMSLEWRKTFSPRIFLNQFRNVYLEDNCPFMDFKIRNKPHKLFFFGKPTEYFPLMVRDSDNAFYFHAKDFFILVINVGSIIGFI